MAQQIINLGTAANTGTGDQGRTGGDKVNDNFTEVYHQAGMPWDSARAYDTNDFSKVGNTVYVAQQASTNVDPTTDTDYSHWRPLHTYNILGTVSATGTYPNLVPTGAIMETGSNSSGQFVKFANGIIICSADLTLEGTTDDYRLDWTYPSTMITRDAFSGSVTNFSGVDTRGFWTAIRVVSDTQTSASVVVHLVSGVTVSSSDNLTIRIVATGRWK